MTFDPTKPVQTRDGRKARIVSDKLNDDVYKFVAIIVNDDGSEDFYCYDKNGFYYSQAEPIPFDLINIPEKREMWVNVYEDDAIAYETKCEADFCAPPSRIACVRVEYEVGEGL